MNELPSAQPQGKNHGGYRGETIDIDAVLADDITAAQESGWGLESILAGPNHDLIGLTRRSEVSGSGGASRNLRLYLSTGIHGDEPAGPLAARQLLQEDLWPDHVDLWLCPCLNPAGFKLNRRENAHGVDLNRDYRDPQTPETLAHSAWLHRQPPFDLCLCLHEDWEARGFYLYELNPDRRPSLAEAIVAGVGPICPIDPSEVIDGRPARQGIIRPEINPQARPLWPEALFLLTQKTRLSYTLEAPSDFPRAVRVAALVAAVRAALRTVSALSG
jgi:murein peptide amidase A